MPSTMVPKTRWVAAGQEQARVAPTMRPTIRIR